MPNRYSFGGVKHVGEWACETLIGIYELGGRAVADVQDDPFFRVIDVDLVVCQDLDVELVEVKGDRYPCKNLYVELVSNTSKNTEGCLFYTGADTIAYYYVNEGTCLFIPALLLKEWITQPGNLEEKYKKKVVTSKGDKDLYESIGYTVPVDRLLADIPEITRIDRLPRMEMT